MENLALQITAISQEELQRRVRWYIKIRWFFLFTLAIVGVGSEYLIFGWTHVVIADLLGIIAVFALNLVFYFLAKSRFSLGVFAFLALSQILIDIVLASFLIYTHGGPQSRTIILYAIPITIAGALFGPVAGFIAAFLSSLLYDLTLVLFAHNWLSKVLAPELAQNQGILVPILFYSAVFFILAAISTFLASLNFRTEQELAQQEAISLASHQLRTPATAVKGYVSTLIDEGLGKVTAEQLEYLQKAFQENERELQLIDTMLSVAQVDIGMKLELSETNLAELVKSVVAEQAQEIKRRGLHVTVDVPESLILRIDPKKFRLVIDNLLSNAIKYTAAAGKIEIKLEQLAKVVKLSIKDSGIGISRRDMSKLFKRYSRLAAAKDYNASGSGLGLYLVKRIVELHKGSVKVASSPGQGSNFTISLRRKNG